MEILFEAIGEAILELLFDASKSKKIPLWIRILILTFLSVIYLGIVAICLIAGIKLLDKNLLFGICFILISIFILIAAIYAIFKKRK